MSRIQTSIALAKASWGVLRDTTSLMLLPLFSFLATAVTVALFAGGALATGDRTGDSFRLSLFGWVISAVGYIVLACISIYFNAALVSAANERLAGGEPTIDSALAGANAHLPQIIGWGIISGTVSMILRQIQENSGILGRVVTAIAGIAWSLVTYLVLPILVIEGVGVRQALTRSKELFTRTWGERVMGNVGIGIIGVIAFLAAVPVVILGAISGNAGVLIGTIVLAALWIGLVACATSAMGVIFQTALYRYAALGEVPGGWDQATLTSAFPPKKQRAGLFGR